MFMHCCNLFKELRLNSAPKHVIHIQGHVPVGTQGAGGVTSVGSFWASEVYQK